MRRDAALVQRLADGTATYGLNVQVRRQPTPLLQAAHPTITGSPYHYYRHRDVRPQRAGTEPLLRILVIDEQGPGLPSPARADRRMGVYIGVGLDVLIDVG